MPEGEYTTRFIKYKLNIGKTIINYWKLIKYNIINTSVLVTQINWTKMFKSKKINNNKNVTKIFDL